MSDPHLLLLHRVNLLEGPGRPTKVVDALISGQRLQALAEPGGLQGPWQSRCHTLDAQTCWLAPPLVDPHSVLDDPYLGRAETLTSLLAAAAAGGYGSVALLPWASAWRDRPERLAGLGWPAPMHLHLWGSFCLEGQDRQLAGHGDQLAAGAIGLAAGDSLPPLGLLERGLSLAEMVDKPILLPVRDDSLCRDGFVRERVEALRAGWPVDPALSEILPLQTLLTLAGRLPQCRLRLMNLSTAEGVSLLRQHQPDHPLASVCWWHLVSDSGALELADEGWKLVPSLGGPGDRRALIQALAEGLISAVAVHHQPLDAEEQLLPLDQRPGGLAGHGLVLPLLWQELVRGHGWQPTLLWERLCWGPARFLGVAEEALAPGSQRWLLFDAEKPWLWHAHSARSLAANPPWLERPMVGQVVASGLTAVTEWLVPGFPSC
ncbi:MAG: dihydroorotase [Cyanobacteria bacterium]|jgi:dihydroorotase|nr:dihydroorotase [Cyanobacteriota bacterium]